MRYWWEWYGAGFASMLAFEIACVIYVTRKIRRDPQFIIRAMMRKHKKHAKGRRPIADDAANDAAVPGSP